MKQSQTKFDYVELNEWLRSCRLSWADLAREIGVSGAAVSRYKTEGRPFPSMWILEWKRIYRWSWPETIRFCLE